MSRPLLVLVTGPAGAGKTTLATRLGGDLGCPVVSRDLIKEGMVTTWPDFVPSPSDPLILRAHAVFFELLRVLLTAGVSVVAEAAFQHHRWAPGLRPLLGRADPRLLRCRTDDAYARAVRRLGDPRRRAHADREHLQAGAAFEEARLPVPTLDLITSDGYDPAYAEVLAFCRDPA